MFAGNCRSSKSLRPTAHLPLLALNSLNCADVPLRICSLTQQLDCMCSLLRNDFSVQPVTNHSLVFLLTFESRVWSDFNSSLIFPWYMMKSNRMSLLLHSSNCFIPNLSCCMCSHHCWYVCMSLFICLVCLCQDQSTRLNCDYLFMHLLLQ